MKRFSCAVLVTFLFSTCLHAASSPLFRASPERTGALIEEAVPRLEPRWNFQIQGEFVSSPAIYKGIVYCGGRDGSVWAWDAATGEQIWQYSVDDWIDATPCVSSDTVYVPSRDRNLYALDRLTGTLRWQTYTGSQDSSSPVLYEGKLYFLSGFPEKKLYCIDAADGSILHSFPISQFSFSSPAVYDNLLYFGTNNGMLYCYDLATGLLAWERPTIGSIFFSSLAAGETGIYAAAGGDERRIFCLDPRTGAILWRSRELDENVTLVSSVSLGQGRVFVVCSKATAIDQYTYATNLTLYAFPAVSSSQEQEPLWNTAIGTPHRTEIVSSPSIANNTVYVGSGDGRLYCLDAVTGKYIAPGTGDLSDAATGYYLSYAESPSTGIVATPAVSNGWVYVGTFDGNFWAFQAMKRAFISAPDTGDTVTTQAAVIGEVAGFPSENIILSYGAGADPNSWLPIATSTGPEGTLGTWDASALPDGDYALRLTESNTPALQAINRVTVDNPPGAPGTLTAMDTPFDGGGSLTLAWSTSADDGAGDNDVQGYRIYRSTGPGGFAACATTAKAVYTYTDTACPVQTTYYYQVAAFDRLNESAMTNTASAFSLVDGIEITPESGGTIVLDHAGLRTEIVVEPGSVASTVRMGILIPADYPDTGVPPEASPTGMVREFGVSPAGTAFLKPVLIKMPYRDADTAGMARENLRIYWHDTQRNAWRIVNTSDPLLEEGKVCARIPHFSLYRIMGYRPGTAKLLSDESVYTYPNPAREGTLYFKYLLGDRADVTIDIFSVAGQRVAHLEKAGNPAGLVSELAWDISGIASGVYVYRLEARSATETRSLKKKLAIIH